ncbi:MAG: enoyl-CoA hydratase-related protein, partial [Pseudomonadota bacterium]
RLNSFTVQMYEEIRTALAAIKSEANVRVLVITGAGRAFSAGQDLADRAVTPGDEAIDLGASVETYYAPLIRTLTALPFPVIAAVNGVAAGAGASVALAADIVIAAKRAKFIMSFANIGLVPDSGASWVLPRAIGQSRALGMALTGEPVSAQSAADWALIWKCADDDCFLSEVDALVHKLAAAPTLGLAATKRLIRSAFTQNLTDQLDRERDDMRRLGQSQDYREGVDAFINKRTPTFVGR